MEYSVTCACQRVIPVAAAQAGTEVACACGRAVKVPRLSQLRTATGKAAYKPTVIEAIERLTREGDLPFSETCALCGMPTSDSIELYAECERARYRPPSVVPWWLLWLPWAPVIWLMSKFLPLPGETQGRDTGVTLPLRVCKRDQGRLPRNQRKLRDLLRPVPIYEQLLEEYPRARIYTDG